MMIPVWMNLLLWWLPSDDISNFKISYTFINCFLLWGRAFSSNRLIHWLTSAWTPVSLYYSTHYHPLLFYLFWCSICPRFGHWEPFMLNLVSFRPIIKFFEHFLTFQHTVCSSLILYILYSSPGNSYCTKECWVLLVEMVFRNEDLDATCTQCYGGITVSSGPR